MRGIISRFAPAPTGFLHLGHVVNAAYVWKETRARAGRVLLRIEDHDRQRSRRFYEDAILQDLAWLGFDADEPPVRQSERHAIYESALEGLRRRGLVYACNCSRSEIAANAAGLKAVTSTAGLQARTPLAGLKARTTNEAGLKARTTDELSSTESRDEPPTGVVQAFRPAGTESPTDVVQGFSPADPELRYPGTCAHRGLAEGPGVGLRIRLEPSVERFVDLRLGPQEQRPSEQCGDVLARDRDGNWTYQFAATVDDYVQGVTLVIRGIDLLASTGRQIQLARLLGRDEPPAFMHHALIMKSAHGQDPGAPRQKLSKSDRDTGIRELRARGWTPAQVIDTAMAAAGR
jgi:glutamyl-tRNA synthetase/glutamyl-Q tRNA(Asp) synthetase